MKSVKAVGMKDDIENEKNDRNAQGQAKYMDRSPKLISKQISKCDFEVVFEHIRIVSVGSMHSMIEIVPLLCQQKMLQNGSKGHFQKTQEAQHERFCSIAGILILYFQS